MTLKHCNSLKTQMLFKTTKLLLASLCTLTLRAAPPTAPETAELQITSLPDQATVFVDRIERGTTPLTLSTLPPGDHLVVLSKRDHHDHYTTITLSPNAHRAINATLKPLTTLAIIHSTPSGATVTADGIDLGTTPLLLTTLPPGKHRFRLSLAGFQTSEREITTDPRSPVKLAVDLLSDSGTLTITTTPPGASVSVNGIPRGESPCTVERIPEGDATVIIRATGYLDSEQRVKLSAGEIQHLNITLPPRPARLQVSSLPTGARVYVNNNRRGETPLTLENLAPGSYRLRVEQDGYDPMARDVELTRGADTTEEFRLAANTGSLQVTTTPAGVEVFVAGKRAGVTAAAKDETTNLSKPLLIDGLHVGEQQIKFIRQGWTEETVTIDITRGTTATRHVALKRLFIPDYEVVTISGTVYRGVFEAITDIGIRMETAPGVMTVVPHKEIRRRGTLRLDLHD